MTDFDDEREVSRLYRKLRDEQPPARVDEAIRAEARVVAGTVPAPLVPPTGRRRWYFPLAAAAVIVLAVAVTWHVEREQPDQYVAEAPRPAAAPAPAPQKRMVEKAPEPRRDAPEQLAKQKEPAPGVPPAAPSSRADEAQTQPGAAGARSEARARMAMERAPETPEQWLERIARLRAEGRHEDADRELAEFRKRHPDFRIAPEILEKVEKK